MGELEDQIARLAQHRADQVPAYREPARLDRARASRRGVWLAVAAALTAVVVAAGALVWSHDDDPSVRTGPAPATDAPAPTTIPPTVPPTTPPTTAPAAAAPCPVEQVDTNPMSSVQANGGELVNVQIQTSACVDEVAFSFRASVPEWSVEYRSGPLTLEPSGQPVSVEGNAFLVVRFNHADAVRSGYSGPKDLRAGPLSHVTEVRQTQDFEGVLTWVIGLDGRLPFGVEERAGQVVVRFPESGTERAVQCEVPELHLSLTLPPGWFTELSEDRRCRSFGPAPASDRPVLVDVSPSTSVADLFGPTTQTTLTTADGRTASCVEGAYAGSSYFPAGEPGFVCVVAWGDGQNLTVTTNGYAGPRYADYKAGVQAIVASARYVP